MILSPRNRQSGLTLVELMVALVAGLLLTAGVGTIFTSSSRTYRTEEALGRLQESGRFAIELLARDVRMAGYMGCASINEVEPHVIAENPPAKVIFTADDLVGGLDDVTGNEADLPGSTIAGTDVLTVRHASLWDLRLTGNMGTDNANIQITDDGGIEAGDLLFISDCTNADVFRASNVSQTNNGKVTIAHANSVNIDNRLSKAYQEDAQIMGFEANTFYVRPNPSNVPALYRQDFNGATQELVEGVENLQVRYGVDTDNDGGANQYLDADAVANWDRVVSVQVALLLRTVDEVSPEPVAYDFQFYDINAPADRRLRREFVTTVNLRNRSL